MFVQVMAVTILRHLHIEGCFLVCIGVPRIKLAFFLLFKKHGISYGRKTIVSTVFVPIELLQFAR
jgi:hypothetical protein